VSAPTHPLVVLIDDRHVGKSSRSSFHNESQGLPPG
jgi:hypothetical protein